MHIVCKAWQHASLAMMMLAAPCACSDTTRWSCGPYGHTLDNALLAVASSTWSNQWQHGIIVKTRHRNLMRMCAVLPQ